MKSSLITDPAWGSGLGIWRIAQEGWRTHYNIEIERSEGSNDKTRADAPWAVLLPNVSPQTELRTREDDQSL